MMPRPGWNGRGVQAAKNPQIDINIINIAEFDKRLKSGINNRDHEELWELIQWADAKGLTLGHKAQEAINKI
jgi:hypothetical protein